MELWRMTAIQSHKRRHCIVAQMGQLEAVHIGWQLKIVYTTAMNPTLLGYLRLQDDGTFPAALPTGTDQSANYYLTNAAPSPYLLFLLREMHISCWSPCTTDQHDDFLILEGQHSIGKVRRAWPMRIQHQNIIYTPILKVAQERIMAPHNSCSVANM